MHFKRNLFLGACAIVSAVVAESTARCLEIDMNIPIEVGLPDLPADLNPAHIGTLVQWTLHYNLSDRLLDGGLQGQIRPGLAKSWEVDVAKNQIIFHLRGDRHFSDGSSITADDVFESFRFHYLENGSSKFKLKDHLEVCGSKIGSSCEGIKLRGREIIFQFKPGLLADPLLFAIADFGIYPKKILEEKKLDRLFAITSGPYSIQSRDRISINLQPNKYYHSKIDQAIRVVDTASFSEPLEWMNKPSASNKIVRLPDWGTLDISSVDFKTIESSTFWVRLGFVPLFGSVKDTTERRLIRDLLREAIILSTGQKIIPRIFPPFETESELTVHPAHSVLTAPLKIVINFFSFTQVEKVKLEQALKQKFPKATFEWFKNLSDFLNRIKLKKFDAAIVQYTFGPIDPYPAAQYIKTVYFQNELPKHFLESISHLHDPHKREERRIRFKNLNDDLESEGLIFNLGSAKARFLFSNKLHINGTQLISGEFDFTSILPADSTKKQ